MSAVQTIKEAIVEWLNSNGVVASVNNGIIHTYVESYSTNGQKSRKFTNIALVGNGIRVGGWGKNHDILIDDPNSLQLLLRRLLH